MHVTPRAVARNGTLAKVRVGAGGGGGGGGGGVDGGGGGGAGGLWIVFVIFLVCVRLRIVRSTQYIKLPDIDRTFRSRVFSTSAQSHR